MIISQYKRTLNKIRNNHQLSSTKLFNVLVEKSTRLRNIYYDSRAFVDSVAIENTTECNRRCPYCPHFWTPRPKKTMSEALFQKIIDDLSDLSYGGTISFAPWGEPLLDDRLPSFVQYTKKMLPKSKVLLTTNGDKLALETYKILVNTGVDEFDVSDHYKISSKGYVIEAPTAAIETYRRLNVEEKKRIHFHDYNYKRIRGIDVFHNRSGWIPLENEVSIQASYSCCTFAESIMTITHKGEVVLCARQWDSTPTFGNVRTEHIGEIWEYKEYKQFRKNLRRGIFELDLCRKCGFGNLPSANNLIAIAKKF